MEPSYPTPKGGSHICGAVDQENKSIPQSEPRKARTKGGEAERKGWADRQSEPRKISNGFTCFRPGKLQWETRAEEGILRLYDQNLYLFWKAHAEPTSPAFWQRR